MSEDGGGPIDHEALVLALRRDRQRDLHYQDMLAMSIIDLPPPGAPAPLTRMLIDSFGPTHYPSRLVHIETPNPIIGKSSTTTVSLTADAVVHAAGSSQSCEAPTKPFSHLNGLRLELLGLAVDETSDPTPAELERMWHLKLHWKNGEMLPISFVALRRRLYWSTSDLYIEFRWKRHDDSPGDHVRLGGIETQHDSKIITKLITDAPALMAGISRDWGNPGRPARYSSANELEFFTALGKAVHTVVRRGDTATYASLSRNGMAVEWRTIQKYVDQFGYDLRAIEEEAVRCTNRAHTCRYFVGRESEFKVNGR